VATAKLDSSINALSCWSQVGGTALDGDVPGMR
jgi:hypothetical protein